MTSMPQPEIDKLVEQYPAERVSRAEWQGNVVWIKQACAPKSKVWHRIQSALTAIIPYPLIRPTVSSGGAEAIAAEAERIGAFAMSGVYVPRIVAQGEKYLVLSDAGVELKAFLDRETDKEKRWQLLMKATQALAQLHATGFVHGRPHLKDFVYHEQAGLIGFIDLEEDPLSVMPRDYAEARDIWLFLCSTARFLADEPARIGALYHLYLSQLGLPPQLQLRRLVRTLEPFRAFVERLLYNHVGKDVKYVVIANKQLERYFDNAAAI